MPNRIVRNGASSGQDPGNPVKHEVKPRPPSPPAAAPVIKIKEEELITGDVPDGDDHDPPAYYECVLIVTPDSPVFKKEVGDNSDLLQSPDPTLEGSPGPSASSPLSSSNRLLPFQCKFCHQVFHNSDERQSHIRNQHYHSRMVTCQHCHKLFHGMRYKLLHLRNGWCRGLKAAAPLQQNMGGRRGTKKLSCKFCAKSFRTKDGLGGHLTKMHSTGAQILRFPCSLCQQSFLTRYQLKGHQQAIHHVYSQGQFSCRYCIKSFSTEYLMTKHETCVCKRNPDLRPRGEGGASNSVSSSCIVVFEEPLITPVCQHVASSSSRRKQIFHQTNQFPCQHCRGLFTSETNHSEHQRVDCEALLKLPGINDADASLSSTGGSFGHHDQLQQVKEEEQEQLGNIFLDPLE